MCFETAVVNKKLHKTSGGNGKRDTPVSIPNTEVKPLSADGTWVETPWESRTLPDYIINLNIKPYFVGRSRAFFYDLTPFA